MNATDYIRLFAQFFVLVGALNWGTYGVFGVDIIQVLFGQGTQIATFFYATIGLSGLFIIMMKAALRG
jgi:uncharacterized membrane protein YuzA (DUF378 family)